MYQIKIKKYFKFIFLKIYLAFIELKLIILLKESKNIKFNQKV
jgi:hypothetical protein